MRVETKKDQVMIAGVGDDWRVRRQMLYPRRWAAHKKSRLRNKADGYVLGTADSITVDEARTAVAALLIKANFNGTRVKLNQIEDYDARSDKFHCIVSNAQKELFECWVPGESVAEVVKGCRQLSHRDKGKRMKRPSELKREFRHKVMSVGMKGDEMHIELPLENH
jgi:hypothetical protein